MRTTWILVLVCGLVLGGAWLASRLLLTDEPVPAAPTSNAKPVVAAPVDPPMNAAVLPPALARQKEPGMVLPAVGQPGTEPVMKAPPPPPPGEPSIPADVAESPFQGRSEELDYAEGILGETTPTQQRLESALGVFKRCVEQEPENQRCHRALVLARSKLGLTTELSVTGKIIEGGNKKTPEPSSEAERLNQMRPPAQLK